MSKDRSPCVPSPITGDEESVVWALSTAGSLQQSGDLGGSLKWLRRAANTAAERGLDGRAVELFKAAADLASHLEAAEIPTLAAGGQPYDDERTIPLGYKLTTSEDVDVDAATRRHGARDLPGVPAPAPVVALAGVQVAAVNRRVVDDITEVPFTKKAAMYDEPTHVSARTTIGYTAAPIQVAVVASADGTPRIIRVDPSAPVPEGSAVVTLTPASPDDARRLAELLG